MITPAQRAEIRHLYYGEHWKLGTIAAQLGLHRETVRAAVERGRFLGNHSQEYDIPTIFAT